MLLKTGIHGCSLFPLILTMITAGCAESGIADGGPWTELILPAADTSSAISSVGSVDGGLEGPAFGALQSGTIAPGGQWFAVADRFSPHIGVFSEDGKEISAFLGDGEGPLESRGGNQFILADSDSTLLVLEADRLRRFSILGELVGDYALAARGFRPVGLGRGCAGKPNLLSPRIDPQDPNGPVGWVHRIETGDPTGIELVPIWKDEALPGRGLFLSNHKLLSVGDLLLFRREVAGDLKFGRAFCGPQGSLRAITEDDHSTVVPVPPSTVLGRSPDDLPGRPEPEREYVLIASAHALGDQAILRVHNVFFAGEQFWENHVHLSVQRGADTIAAVRFPVFFEILDILADRALVLFPEPSPRVFLFDLPFPG